MTTDRTGSRQMKQVSIVGRMTAFLLVVVVAMLVFASSAQAAFGLQVFDGELLAADGTVANQAGGHPKSQSVAFRLNSTPDPWGAGVQLPDGAGLRNARVDLPVGFVGNPQVVAECTETEFWRPVQWTCPRDSQVGIALVELQGYTMVRPVYNMVPSPGAPAVLAFRVTDVGVHMRARLRSDGDYGLSIDSLNVNQSVSILGVTVNIWGVPADPSHDFDRGGPASMPPRPFFTNPTSCGPAETTIDMEDWSVPAATDSGSFLLHEPGNPGVPVAIEGCERLPFDPEIDVRPDSTVADAPTGLAFDLKLPQHGLENKDALATAHLRDATVRLPEGMSISPSGAEGLAACSDEQLDVGTTNPSRCPEASKIGTVTAVSPLLKDPLVGGVFVGEQRSSDPVSGDMFRLFLTLANEERGLAIKLRGKVRLDPSTGRVETTFVDNPQQPLSSLSLKLKGGPRAPLANPTSCGTKTIEVELGSWAGQRRTLTDSFTIDCPGTTGFAPSLAAGSLSPVAGAFSPFIAQIDRDDRQQYVSGVSMDMPKGVLAKLKGVELCPDAVAGDGTPGMCPAGSRVGTATVGSGPGTRPFHLRGGIYLTGPYNGGPYGLSVQVPAKAGPYNLGMVKVRQSIRVDPQTADVAIVSDPLPQIVKGVPVRLRSADVDVDRAGFTVNPTSCATKEGKATFTSAEGAVSNAAQRFKVGDCAALSFKPRLAMRLTGKRQIRTGKHPGIRAQVKMATAETANIRQARVQLPKSIALDPENAQALCEFADGTKPDLENHCPKGSIVGRATARTPLLDRPLTGDVYFVKNVERHPKTGALIRKLPMIVLALRGQIAINLKGEASTGQGAELVSTFAQVPDAPITRFNLRIDGGKTGILAVTRTRQAKINLCHQPNSHTAQIEMAGHNGKRRDFQLRVTTPCTKAAKAKAAKAAKSKRRR